jgi:hypothetical protein
MKLQSFALLPLAFLPMAPTLISAQVVHSDGYSTVRTLKAGSSFPDNAVPNGHYEVTQGAAQILSGGDLVLPDGFTITVAPDVDRIDWTFDKLLIGKGAKIDLSRQRPIPKPATAAPGSSTYTCTAGPAVCGNNVQNIENGGPGGNGISGVLGLDAAAFRLVVHGIPVTGGLWIKTDGATGGPGGNGGSGGHGNWGSCNGSHYHRGADGGPGGQAGQGGYGGSTSFVEVMIIDPTTGQVDNEYKGGCAKDFSPSTKPAETDSNNGLILVYGAPGQAGGNGSPGPGGERGHGINCGTGRKDVPDGSNGPTGPQIAPAQNGRCLSPPR